MICPNSHKKSVVGQGIESSSPKTWARALPAAWSFLSFKHEHYPHSAWDSASKRWSTGCSHSYALFTLCSYSAANLQSLWIPRKGLQRKRELPLMECKFHYTHWNVTLVKLLPVFAGDLVGVCSQSPSLQSSQTSCDYRLMLEAVTVSNVTHQRWDAVSH